MNKLNKMRLLMMMLMMASYVVYGQCDFKTIGHRGGASYNYPENTLLSLKHGFSVEGLYAAEIDVRKTKDSVLMLMHDYYIDRTTNGHGEVKYLNSDYLKSLDAGVWKGDKFAGNGVPTLKEAIQLAMQYGKKLYLNMKVFEPQLVASTLKQINAPSDVILLDPDDTTKVRIYHQLMPDVPLVYFGAPPDSINDTTYYHFLKTNGVIAVELYAGDILDTANKWPVQYKQQLEKWGIDVWAYTINNTGYMQKLKDFGIKGLETDRPEIAHSIYCDNKEIGFFPEKRITGQWDFKNKNLNATIGSQLVEKGDSTAIGQKSTFGKISDFNIPLIENTDVNIMQVAAYDSAHYLTFYSNISPQGNPGGLFCDNDYTLIMDILKPASIKDYISLYQTSNNNSDDGDIFINTASDGVGILGNYNGLINDSTWYRLAFVFDLPNEQIIEYINGIEVGNIYIPGGLDGRFCINNNWGVQPSNLFSDDDNETSILYVSSIQIRDYAMTADEVSFLGGVSTNKISDSIIINPQECPTYNLTDTHKEICENIEGSISVNAADTFNFKWQINMGSIWEDVTDTAFKNSSFKELVIPKTLASMNNYRFRCQISNNCQIVTDSIILKINNAPQIITQPLSITVKAEEDTTFKIYAIGTNIAYQWQIKNDQSWLDLANNSTYSGVNTAAMEISDITKTMNGMQYRCKITGTCQPDDYSEIVTLSIDNTLIAEIGSSLNNIKIINNEEMTSLIMPDNNQYTIKLLNSIGQCVSVSTISGGIYNVNLKNGLYLLHITDGKQERVIKIVNL
ncbi:MAG: hypothetical protein A2X02_02750 [Bacteroidetes bacterium GWF2_29_10]|nr:MAG: hypothetical protein A2X02_02750 [Bacteroidetes bacterium GWF2_29_10]